MNLELLKDRIQAMMLAWDATSRQQAYKAAMREVERIESVFHDLATPVYKEVSKR